ncbi:MAG: hypothetical protein GQ564_04080, partial [Bacteroidales bacterium]|nr:hypothetical protein [Bacteroidales bacterium]
MNENKTYYKSFDNFIIRTPILSLNYIQSVFSNKDTTVETIQEICKDPIVNEAFYLASPDLHKQLIKWLNKELTDQKETENLKFTITKYLMRMGSRCTPFGLFAGYSLGKIGE